MAGERNDAAASDAEFFNGLMPDEPEAQAKDEPGQIGDESAGTQPPDELAAQKPDHRIPLAELLDERDRRQAAERQREMLEQQLMALRRQQQAAQQTPDVFQDPEAFTRTLERRVEQQVQTRFLNVSFADAHESQGEQFEAAYEALLATAIHETGGDLANGRSPTRDRIINSGNPGKALMRWHGEREAVRETGGDLSAYRQRVLDEALSDPEFRKTAMESWRGDAARPANVTRLLSLSGSTAAARGAGTEDESDEEFFNKSLRLQR
jgi:hypothetical protein